MCRPEARWTLADKAESVIRKAVESGTGCVQPGQCSPAHSRAQRTTQQSPPASGQPTSVNEQRGCRQAGRLGKPLHGIASCGVPDYAGCRRHVTYRQPASLRMRRGRRRAHARPDSTQARPSALHAQPRRAHTCALTEPARCGGSAQRVPAPRRLCVWRASRHRLSERGRGVVARWATQAR